MTLHTTDDLRARLRLEVGRFRAGERRRRFDALLCVGTPAGRRQSVVVPARPQTYVDRADRVELLLALLEVAPEGSECAWLCRPGAPVRGEGDVAWRLAAEVAFGGAGVPLRGCYVVTRHGWVDVRTGEAKVWKRLRLRENGQPTEGV